MAFLALVLTACTTSGPVSIPDTLQPQASQSLKMVVAATGVQIYECRPSANRADFE
jgi:starvation-inducible outer membrane lipoprotein